MLLNDAIRARVVQLAWPEKRNHVEGRGCEEPCMQRSLFSLLVSRSRSVLFRSSAVAWQLSRQKWQEQGTVEKNGKARLGCSMMSGPERSH